MNVTPFTVPPVSRHWSCQSGELSLRAWISGDVQVGIRLRPVNSMHLARKKGSPRCAVKLLFREFIKSVSNFLQKTSSRKLTSLKIPILLYFLAFLDVPDNFLGLFLTSIGVSSYLDSCWVQTFKLFCFTKTKISPLKFLRNTAGGIITMSWVWLIFRQLCQWESVNVWKHSALRQTVALKLDNFFLQVLSFILITKIYFWQFNYLWYYVMITNLYFLHWQYIFFEKNNATMWHIDDQLHVQLF